jgi:DNA-directed RNA polymerase specialized sigma24 family protein
VSRVPEVHACDAAYKQDQCPESIRSSINQGAADRAYEGFARELELHETPTADMEQEICACVSRLAATLKPEYADALQAIEVAGVQVKTYAEQKGLSSSNAAVRVFRAREALKKRVTESCGTCAEHGCVNCTCRRA